MPVNLNSGYRRFRFTVERVGALQQRPPTMAAFSSAGKIGVMSGQPLEYGNEQRRILPWSWGWKLLFIAVGVAGPGVISLLPIWAGLPCTMGSQPRSPTTLWRAGYFRVCN